MTATVGDRIRQLRGAENQETFGSRFSVSKHTVMRYETGRTQPDLEFIKQLCQQFEITADWLIFGNNNGELLNKPGRLDLSLDPAGLPQELARRIQALLAPARLGKAETGRATDQTARPPKATPTRRRDQKRPAPAESPERYTIPAMPIKDWLATMDQVEFDALWMEFCRSGPARRGWLQVEIPKRFSEFRDWVEERFTEGGDTDGDGQAGVTEAAEAGGEDDAATVPSVHLKSGRAHPRNMTGGE